jgi:2-polyprenyl-3-methyl-5-hydroxy-6-metoxy-1,4-benzoquinol methylase
LVNPDLLEELVQLANLGLPDQTVLRDQLDQVDLKDLRGLKDLSEHLEDLDLLVQLEQVEHLADPGQMVSPVHQAPLVILE